MIGAGGEAHTCAARTSVAAASSYALQAALTTLIDRLDNSRLTDAEIIRWGCPVPSFGDLSPRASPRWASIRAIGSSWGKTGPN